MMNHNTHFVGGREILLFPWKAPECPWDKNHERVWIPYNATELRNARDGRKGHIQIVRKSRIHTVRMGKPQFGKH